MPKMMMEKTCTSVGSWGREDDGNNYRHVGLLSDTPQLGCDHVIISQTQNLEAWRSPLHQNLAPDAKDE
jgi:hypothetical protein